MKKLFLFGLLLFSGIIFSQNKHQFSTLYPEKTSWTIQGKVLYADYAKSEKGKFKKVVSQHFEAPTRTTVWTIDYPYQCIKYIIRINGNTSVITKVRT